MNRLSIFSIKSFGGPLLATFLISMFMLLMQFLWKYIDDLLGKGLDTVIILELLFYVSASLLPLALPLAILLASIITLGNLGEKNELTALKASGLSLYRILRPLTFVVILLSIGTFYFANYVIPVANLKWHSIIWDIQQTKLTSFLKPGSYTDDIDGFSIRVVEKTDNKVKGITIHDHTDEKVLKTITAEDGEFFKSKKGDVLFLKLDNGTVIEELSDGSKRKDSEMGKAYRAGRKSKFTTATYKMNMSGFTVDRSEDERFTNEYEMLNVFQINHLLDSLKTDYKNVADNFEKRVRGDLQYYQSVDFLPAQSSEKENADSTYLDQDSVQIDLAELSDNELSKAYKTALTRIREKQRKLNGQLDFEDAKHNNLRRFKIEFHRKFALSFTIIVLFFIGAPLGAIVKKGGFGAPVVIAVLLFMIYFVLISVGEGMAENFVVSPFWGMWGPSFILAPFAIFLMISAANDRSPIDIKAWQKRFSKKK
ncbi:lipopolysaccharide export system permease protein [Lishizhenia tianjinensis]|uniref:Lipopolysaccharide export system permease protein n=1 Tax=Lishizhenia tianjinensis TaxID=477690 RepID=A0A1I6YXQ7_9FLAO|nr:LptF/LptG family permease [Lishizhenia tianjinensis]SFT55088.1 lipopolysaccharide export system permease protein [Lishizhenia tianjinensis]